MELMLIARKNGSSSSRRQRNYPNVEEVNAAIKRWRAEGFTAFWVFDRLGAVKLASWVEKRREGVEG